MASQDFDEHDPATRTAQAFRALCDDSRSAHLLNRYETCYHRQYTRLLNYLMEGRARKTRNFPTNLVNSDTEATHRPA